MSDGRVEKMMCRMGCTWNTGKVLGAIDSKGFRVRLGEYGRRFSNSGPRSTIHGVKPVKPRRKSAPSSSAQDEGIEVKASWSLTEVREGNY